MQVQDLYVQVQVQSVGMGVWVQAQEGAGASALGAGATDIKLNTQLITAIRYQLLLPENSSE